MSGDIFDYLDRHADRDEPEEKVCGGCGQRDCECDLEPDDLPGLADPWVTPGGGG